ncbi:MAG: hypothetical protein N2C12_13765, partial [Planctomycetales bacterium]
SAPHPQQPSRKVISSDDLNHRLVVIGPLGVPLGEMTTIEGTAVINPGKGASNLFEITSVNGRGLSKPITMSYRIWPWSDVKKLDAKARYRLRVYQDGGFAGVPAQAMKETTYVQTHAYNFVTSLVVVRNANAVARVSNDR